MSLPTFFSAEIEPISLALTDVGCALVRSVVPPGLLAEAIEHSESLHEAPGDKVTETSQVYRAVFNRDPFWLSFVDLAPIAGVAGEVLGRAAHILGLTVWNSLPGFQGLPLHVDRLYLHCDERLLRNGEVKVPVWEFTANIYLTDVTSRRCPTRVVPYSHLTGRPPTPSERESCADLIDVVCEAGDALLFRSDLWHSGSDNVSGSTRRLVQVFYGHRRIAPVWPSWPWVFSTDVLQRATAPQLELLGKPPGQSQ